jgi:hypothetical protein
MNMKGATAFIGKRENKKCRLHQSFSDHLLYPEVIELLRNSSQF